MMCSQSFRTSTTFEARQEVLLKGRKAALTSFQKLRNDFSRDTLSHSSIFYEVVTTEMHFVFQTYLKTVSERKHVEGLCNRARVFIHFRQMCDGRRRDKNVTTKGNTKHKRNVEMGDLEIIREAWQIVYGSRIINRHGPSSELEAII
ncbi:hypothetical protein EGR_06158 [Echinococcus granulosus]|uniref:Uncharacterized protein n=1 Tax=Echinococcus granulosus TaxID=6210 RepID=W6UZB1_ECHGR|nr:hypothetical protein EGR_06158 [Echinococcus granulosus]EUB58939.1 hypothetical protein EGR_06158 [Echinococcus granulosus]